MAWLRLTVAVACTLLVGLGLVACDQNGEAANGEQKSQQMPPEVAVVTVQPGAVQLTTELPGRLEASRVAEVRARVTGVLLKRVFEEGSDVKAGQTLYKIDSAPYEAALQSAKAQLAQAKAQLADAGARARRYKPLADAHAVSEQEYDAAVAAAQAADAQVAAGNAVVRTAQINLGYATVTAPIDGRIGRSLVTEGALVSQEDGTHLATIQQIDPLYVNVSRSATDVLRMRDALQAGQLERASGDEAARVRIVLEDGREYAHIGRLLFTDLSVDPGTGQVALRAEVPNPDGRLLPGMYVRARLQQAQMENAMLLPQQAVQRGSQGDSVMVVADDGSVSPRPVKVEGAQNHQWIVTDGLEPGEKVVVEGQMKLSMGAQKVTPVPWKPEAQAGAEQADSEHAPADAASGTNAD